MMRVWSILVLVGLGSAVGVSASDWTVDFTSPGVTPYMCISEDFLTSGAPWDTDGIEECAPVGDDDVRCEWLEDHVAAGAAHPSNGVIAAVLDGAASQRVEFLSDIWTDTLNSGSVWWVNYDVHYVALDPADLPTLRSLMRFQHNGTTMLTLTLDGQAGVVHVQQRIAPQHNWFDNPETGNQWRIKLTLRRTQAGSTAMVWVDNIDVVEGATDLYQADFALIDGDVNGDCSVNITDLGTLLSNFGQSGATRAQGDLTGDGNVDVSDLGVLLAAFGTNCM